MAGRAFAVVSACLEQFVVIRKGVHCLIPKAIFTAKR